MIIGSAAIINQFLEFELVFPNEIRQEPAYYLKGGNKEVILRAASHFLGFKPKNSIYHNHIELLNKFFHAQNRKFGDNLSIIIQKIESQQKINNNFNHKVLIINNWSSLTLFETFFQLDIGEITQTPIEFEINLMKAYLSINSIFTKNQSLAEESTEELDKEIRYPIYNFCSQYPIYDKVDYDLKLLFFTQLIKAYYFFQYFENEINFKYLYDSFLANFKCENPKSYLNKIVLLILTLLKADKEAHCDINIPRDEHFEINCSFLKKLCLSEDNRMNDEDFIALRSNPMYELSNGIYRVIFNLFLVEKIFKGLYFQLRDINRKMLDSIKISDNKLKGIYCNEFSEKYLLYKILDIIYASENRIIKFSGKYFSDNRIDGGPDYYIRIGNNLLLFESKDFLIKASIKQSFDYDKYYYEFERTLIKEEIKPGKVKRGAVMQLSYFIRKVLKREFIDDTNYQYKKLNIYPILITHDSQYDTPGFNFMVNDWFTDEKITLNDEGYYINKIKPLVVINIDTLIHHQEILSHEYPLHIILDKYNSEVLLKKANLKYNKHYEYIMDSCQSFSMFIDNFLGNLNLRRPPKILYEISPAIFENSN
ncbi:MAG: hypothetical protein IPK88_18390 [Saprospiraceae bacterium]|nr:hypothetical protein [Candidatus Defluviibacterium haderslevense]